MAYIYQADIWCDECGQEICDRIKKEGHAPKHPDDERTFDSDKYPKYADDNKEADSPQHCAAGGDCLNAHVMGDGHKIGCLIGATLTSDGAEYVKEAIMEALRYGENKDCSVALGVWAEEFSDYEILEERNFYEVMDEVIDTLVEQPAEATAKIHNQVCTRRVAPWGDDFVYIDKPKK